MEDFTDALLGGSVVAEEVSHLEVGGNDVGTVELELGLTGIVVYGVAFYVTVVVVVGVEDEGNGFRFLSLLKFGLLKLLVGRKRDAQGLGLDHRGTEHEERNQKHVHVNHGGEIHMDGHLFLGAFFLFAAR